MSEKNIWIFAEYKESKISSAYYELLSKARTIADEIGETKLSAVILGDDISQAVDQLRSSGVDRIYAIESPELSCIDTECYPLAITEIVKKYDPDMFWIPATTDGGELAPTVAAKLRTGLAAHCVDIKVREDGEILHLVPAFGGRLLSEILIPERRPRMASVKPGVFSRMEIPAKADVEVIYEEPESLENVKRRIKTISNVKIVKEGLPVEEAEIVVAGGIGIKSPETWAKAKEFALSVNAAVGYTRPMIDLGFEDTADNMIGASGKSVRPKLYLAFGISGASHHICGMKDSGTIISVNTDDNAKIFDVSDYKAVADCDSVLTALLKQ